MVSGCASLILTGIRCVRGIKESRNLGNRVSVSLRLLLPRARVSAAWPAAKTAAWISAV